jgi:hypothetical protein
MFQFLIVFSPVLYYYAAEQERRCSSHTCPQHVSRKVTLADGGRGEGETLCRSTSYSKKNARIWVTNLLTACVEGHVCFWSEWFRFGKSST